MVGGFYYHSVLTILILPEGYLKKQNPYRLTIFKTTVLPVVLYKCKTFLLNPRE
jgi:hypothetical protein